MADEINNTQNSEVQQAVTQALDEQKKKKKKKRLIIIGIILAVIIIGVALGSSGGNDEKETTAAQITAQEDKQAEGQIGNYLCTVKEAKLCKDWDGKDAVKITYSFTNNASEAESFDVALDDNVYQNGVGLETTWLDDEEDDNGIDVKIKPGTTKDVVKVYKLRDTKTELEVEIGEWLSFDTKVTTKVKLEK